jgi:undecaprenyl-diphosphatase
MLASALSMPAFAGGPLGIDHLVPYDDSGIWNRSNQNALRYGTILVVVGGALWEGDQSRIGHAFWQATDSLALAGVSAAVLKPVFSRSRPAQSPDPDLWFQGHGHNSFPSAEVAEITSAVTPFMLEYGRQYPAVYALALLPVYDGVARIKVQAHWQTDVLAGIALGAATGYYAHNRPSSFFVQVLPGGVSVGLRARF